MRQRTVNDLSACSGPAPTSRLISAEEYGNVYGCTARAAWRDLSTLAEMGVIAVKREGRLRRYVPNPVIADSQHGGRTSTVIDRESLAYVNSRHDRTPLAVHRCIFEQPIGYAATLQHLDDIKGDRRPEQIPNLKGDILRFACGEARFPETECL